MRYKVTENAPADIYGKPVKANDVISLSKKQAANLLLKGHIEADDGDDEDATVVKDGGNADLVGNASTFEPSPSGDPALLPDPISAFETHAAEADLSPASPLMTPSESNKRGKGR